MWWWSWGYTAKYNAAVKARKDRNTPLSGLRAAPALVRVLQDGPQNAVECFKDALGLEIAVYCWPARGKAKGVVQMLHGLDGCAEGDLAKRPGMLEGKGYVGSWLEALNDAGYTVYAADYNGMGRSEGVVDGLPSMCFTWDDYVDDNVQLFGLLKQRHPELPFAILGGSRSFCCVLFERPSAGLCQWARASAC